MISPSAEVAARLHAAFDVIEAGADPVLKPSDRADLQANGALPLAKRLGRDAREVAAEVLERLDLAGICDQVELSGPGFINLTFADSYLAEQLAAMARDARLGIGRAEHPETIVVDYSAPNVAKEMHVGHLRTTVIGDCLVRILDFLGHDVRRQNHIGDWGTPFGMLIEHLIDVGEKEAAHELSVGDLNRFYQAARASFEANEDFRNRSRRRVVLLQSGDPETRRLWRLLVDESVRYFDVVYEKLGVLLTDDDIVGESFYNPMLPDVVSDLAAKGLLIEHEGAKCVFPAGFTNRKGEPLPLIVQKSDGGYGYAATDLAAIRDRVNRIGATRLLYVVGTPQSQHLQMCFAVARMAGWLPDNVSAVHVGFGNVLGPDGRMLKTRSGESVKLVDLLDEAIQRAASAILSRGEEESGGARHIAGEGEPALSSVARMVGIGAVKYADLSTDRTRDYVFDWDRMLAFEGNTGPYLQYAHARICSIFRRGKESFDRGAPSAIPIPPKLGHPQERALGIALLRLVDVLDETIATYSPHKLSTYLYSLATTFTDFYEHCRVLVDDEVLRRSRLLLSELTARVLALGLGLLGIEAPERM